MIHAITISGSAYIVRGTVRNDYNNKGVVDLHVLAYDKDILKDDFLGIGVTDSTGAFSIRFDSSQFGNILDRSPDLYFVVKDAGSELLSTKEDTIQNANVSTPPINLVVSLVNDRLRKLINTKPVEGWIGGFPDLAKRPEMAYPISNSNPLTDNLDDPNSPIPNLRSLKIQGNLENIDKLQRQWKILWPEFSWNSEPNNIGNKKRCYQMFAPDISRLGYTNEGRVYAIICPQQGFSSPHLGSINIEVTVTGCRGWANEATKELAADMTVEGKIWFGSSAHQNQFIKLFMRHFNENNLPFPSSKANAIRVSTFKPGNPNQPIFPFRRGLTREFEVPDFAKHEGIAWSLGHLGVQIGSIVPTHIEKVDKFNQMILDSFNTIAGNMLKENNILTWNVWFTAPELVNQEEWANHAEYWRTSINTDHGSPEGEGTVPRYLDGTPFQPLKKLVKKELTIILAYIKNHL
ncbi:MAG: hypothetical protein ACPG49_01585 [Chitinophagales bacterium]